MGIVETAVARESVRGEPPCKRGPELQVHGHPSVQGTITQLLAEPALPFAIPNQRDSDPAEPGFGLCDGLRAVE